MSDNPYEDPNHHPLLDFVKKLRDDYIDHSPLPTLQAAQEFDEGMRPLVMARMKEIHLEQTADQPTQAQMLMELVLEIDQVVSLVPPKLRAYRERLAAEGLDRTVVPVTPDGKPADPDGLAEGGREGLPGINLADQAALEFHSQLLHLAIAIARDEVEQRLQRQAGGQGPDQL